MAGISAQEMPAFFIAHGGNATGRHKKIAFALTQRKGYNRKLIAYC